MKDSFLPFSNLSKNCGSAKMCLAANEQTACMYQLCTTERAVYALASMLAVCGSERCTKSERGSI